MDLTTPLMYVKGVGPARAAMLEAKGLTTVEDLLAYVPFRYEDRSNVKTDRAAGAGRNGHRDRRGALGQDDRLQAPQPGPVRSRASPIASRAILVGKWFHGGYLANVLRRA